MLKLSHKYLDVWKLSKQLVVVIYRITKSFPKEELHDFAMISKMITKPDTE